MALGLSWYIRFYVALRKESVDRNWRSCKGHKLTHVALRKESVDRNTRICSRIPQKIRRSPQGERG